MLALTDTPSHQDLLMIGSSLIGRKTVRPVAREAAPDHPKGSRSAVYQAVHKATSQPSTVAEPPTVMRFRYRSRRSTPLASSPSPSPSSPSRRTTGVHSNAAVSVRTWLVWGWGWGWGWG